MLMMYTHLTSKLYTFFEGNHGVADFQASLSILMHKVFTTRVKLAELYQRQLDDDNARQLLAAAKTDLAALEKRMEEEGSLF